VPIVEVRNVTKKFMGTAVLDDVSLEIAAGEHIAMMGPNGAGKTTLVRAMLGFYHIDAGCITVDEKDPARARVEVLKNVGFIPQLPPPVKLSIEELLAYVEQSTGTSKVKITAQAEGMELDIMRHLSKPFFKLSGGMKQKLLIAIALAKQSKLLIFDEPTANLDPRGRENFYELLEGIDRSCSTLFITHRIEEVKGLVNRMVYMDLGKVVEDEKL